MGIGKQGVAGVGGNSLEINNQPNRYFKIISTTYRVL